MFYLKLNLCWNLKRNWHGGNVVSKTSARRRSLRIPIPHPTGGYRLDVYLCCGYKVSCNPITWFVFFPQQILSPTKSTNSVVSNPRYGRTHCDNHDQWLDHRAAISAPLNTVLQPVLKRRRSFTSVTSPKDVAKMSKYCLITQNQDEEGVVETQIYKVRETRCKRSYLLTFMTVNESWPCLPILNLRFPTGRCGTNGCRRSSDHL